jgi:hypothetical protein
MPESCPVFWWRWKGEEEWGGEKRERTGEGKRSKNGELKS